MCRRISNCFRKAVKLLIRIFTCLFTCRWRRKKVKTEDDSALKQKNRLTSIRIDEDTVNTVKQLLQNTESGEKYVLRHVYEFSSDFILPTSVSHPNRSPGSIPPPTTWTYKTSNQPPQPTPNTLI